MRLWLLLLLLAVPVLAQPVITCPASVNQGGSVVCTSSAPVATWSVSGLGSIVTVDSTHATYTAPSHVTPNQQWGGCQVLPNDHIYNKRIDSLPLDTNSAAMIAVIAQQINGGPPGDFGINSVGPGTPTQSMVFYYTPGSDGTFYFPARPDLKMENGIDTVQIGGEDHHFITVARDTCQTQEVYSPYPVGFSAICPTCSAQTGVSYALSSYNLPTVGVDAASMPLLPLTYSWAEIIGQSIKHAGRFTLAGGYILPTYRWPAQASTGGGGPWPMGARARLRSSFDCTTVANLYGRALCISWKNYGLILADIGGNWNYQVEQGPYPQAVLDGFDQLHALVTNTDFEVVNVSSLCTNCTTVGGQYVSTSGLTTAPDALITGHPASGPDGTAAIGVIGVTIGTDHLTLTVQAGAPAFQVNAWVNGSATTTLTWALSGDGSLSGSGVYTPPSTEATITSATITAASVADGAVALVIPVTLLPGGTIRINAGDTGTAPALTPTWYGDLTLANPIYPTVSSPYGQGGTWNTTDNTALMSNIGSPPDSVYYLQVPNGNYQVQFLAGVGASEAHSGSPWNPTTTYSANTYVTYAGLSYYSRNSGNTGIVPTSNQAIGGAWVLNERCTNYEAQGQVGAHSYDIITRGGSTLTGTTISVPAKVTNGLLSLARRWAPCLPSGASIPNWASAYLDYGESYKPLVGAFSVVADASPAHITIDNTLGSGVSLNLTQKLQLYPVYWYLASGATYSVSGPGTVDSNGLYTAPTTPQTATATVTATSTVDGTKTATTTIPLTFGTITVTPSAAIVGRTQTSTCVSTINTISYSNVTWSISPSVGSINSTTGVYTAPSTLSVNTAVTCTATSNDDPSHSGTAIINVKVLTPPVYQNLGGNPLFQYTDNAGHTWVPDSGPVVVNPGSGLNQTDNIGPGLLPSPIVSGDLLEYTYLSANYCQGCDYYYQWTLPNSTYQVTLRWNIWNNTPPFNATGVYIENWAINGSSVLSNFDVYTAAGAVNTVLDRTFTVNVTGGTLKVEGSTVASNTYLLLNGISIVDVGSVAPSQTVQFTGNVALSGGVSIR